MAQHITGGEAAQLVFYCDVMIHAEEASHRQLAHDQFYPLLLKRLKKENAYNDLLTDLKWISHKKSEDNAFRILSWAVAVNEKEQKLYGVLQKKDGTTYELNDVFFTSEDLVVEEFDPQNWLGAIYYNIMDVKSEDNEKYYLLFGMRKWDQYENIKMAEVLHFTKGGEPIFGKDVFLKTDKDGTKVTQSRLLLKYSADAMVNLNYNPGLKMIVLDHLIPRMGRVKGQESTLVPDGSYVGYEFDGKMWNYIDKLYTETLDEAPRPKPVLDGRKQQSIFGKKQR
ncbi:MAG: hypothetical protein IPM42_13165 [Saprospiraceae bacterium]|nr:hypothetical protein [Saprospiraceae bacterium]